LRTPTKELRVRSIAGNVMALLDPETKVDTGKTPGVMVHILDLQANHVSFKCLSNS
jgi:hypothetical protein